MSAAVTSWATFGSGPAFNTLPADFQACITSPTQACDGIVGSALHGSGYCSKPAYAQTELCGCVNNSVDCPMKTSHFCSNEPYAYKPFWWTVPGPNNTPSPAQVCASSPLCVNLTEVSGTNNTVTGNTQQCGIITNITNMIKQNPTLSVIVFIMFVILLIVIFATGDDEDTPSDDTATSATDTATTVLTVATAAEAPPKNAAPVA